MLITSTFPPYYYEDLFENIPQAPIDYNGIHFEIEAVNDLLGANYDPRAPKTMYVGGRLIRASVLKLQQSATYPNHPLQFVAEGASKTRILVDIWRDRIEIDHRDAGCWRSSGDTRFPETLEEFIAELEIIRVLAAV